MSLPTQYRLALWGNRILWAASWQNQQCGCVPSEDSDQPGYLPSLIRVSAVRMKEVWVLSYPLSAQRRLRSAWAQSHFVGFVMRWLLSFFSIHIATPSLEDYEQAYIVHTSFAGWKPTSNYVYPTKRSASWKLSPSQDRSCTAWTIVQLANHWRTELLYHVYYTLKFIKRNIQTNSHKLKEIAYKTYVRPLTEYAASVSRRYFCCGSLLLLVLAVRIYTLVQLLC